MSRVSADKRVTRKSLFQRGPQAISGEKDPNYVYRFVNDTGSRIHNFQAAGYMHMATLFKQYSAEHLAKAEEYED